VQTMQATSFGWFALSSRRWPRWQFALTVHPTVVLFGKRFGSFRVFGGLGFVLATAVSMALISAAGLSYVVAGCLLASGFVTFLALAMATKIITGHETLIYYHHEIAILLVAAVLLSASGGPVLPYLDLNAIWLGIFLSCGRCGCLMVGCCHGRPYHWGVKYGDAHAFEGFPEAYVGVRLFPVQALEALVVISIVVACVHQFLQGWTAGTVLTTYVLTYAAARIWLEELRGDRARPYWGRFSEAQWTSLLLIVGIVLGEGQGRLPLSGWHIAMCVGAATSMLVLAASRRVERAVLHPHHASEVAAIIKSPYTTKGSISVRRTSLSIGVSAQSLGRLDSADAVLYSLSRVDRCLTLREALDLARLIVNLASRFSSRQELLHGHHGVFHLILHNTRDRSEYVRNSNPKSLS
jgi:prolipoprotein diacylglyceryltransferase